MFVSCPQSPHGSAPTACFSVSAIRSLIATGSSAAGSPVELDQMTSARHLSLAKPLVGGTVLPTPMPGTVGSSPLRHLTIADYSAASCAVYDKQHGCCLDAN